MLAYDFFYFLVLVFEPSCWVTVFLVLFFFIHSIVYATSLITHLGEQYSLPFVDKKKKKKQQKDDHVILVSENRPGTVNICLYYWMCFLCGSLGTEE